MSSPIAKPDYSQWSARMIKLHQKLSHNHRISTLARGVGAIIDSLPEHSTCIDIGCGDMQIAEVVSQSVPGSLWRCLDLYPLSAEVSSQPRWAKYLQFDGERLPFADQSMDVALFSDVLHHMPVGLPPRMIAEAGRVARRVVIKDHFEYGLWSRTLLRAMDFVGNWAYGVSVPRRYFDRTSFAAAVAESGLHIETLQVGMDLYEHLPLVRNVLKRDWHFVAVLSR